VFVWGEAVVSSGHEQCGHADVFERERGGGRFGLEGIEGDTELLGRDREEGLADGEEVGVVAGVPPIGDANDAGEQGRPVPLEEPPATLPSSHGPHERVEHAR
jgi:hypothetical protein